MRIPRDLSGKDLIKALGKLDYDVTRQSGSHIRLSTERNGTHHVTIPDHRPIKVGTLSGILGDIASHQRMTREELLSLLF